jgi:hypothetical protein
MEATGILVWRLLILVSCLRFVTTYMRGFGGRESYWDLRSREGHELHADWFEVVGLQIKNCQLFWVFGIRLFVSVCRIVAVLGGGFLWVGL